MTTIYDFDPRNLPSELTSAIGLAITSFAQTEQFIQGAIAGCCGLDHEYGLAVTVHMSMPLRLSVLRSVAEIRIDDLDVLDQLDNHIEQIEQCVTKRNYMAHRTWCRHPKTGEILTIKEEARSRLEVKFVTMSIEQVRLDAVFIYEAGISFYSFLHANGLIPALPSGRPREHKSKAARKKRRNSK